MTGRLAFITFSKLNSNRDAFWLREVRQEEPEAEAERGRPHHLQYMFGDEGHASAASGKLLRQDDTARELLEVVRGS